MRRKLGTIILLSILLAALISCTGFETNTYKTLGVLGVSYDTAMKGIADLKKQGVVTDAQWVQVDQAGREFYVVYNGAIDAFQIYLKVKNQASEERVLSALSEATAKLGKIQEYYNIWKGVK